MITVVRFHAGTYVCVAGKNKIASTIIIKPDLSPGWGGLQSIASAPFFGLLCIRSYTRSGRRCCVFAYACGVGGGRPKEDAAGGAWILCL